MNDEAVCAVLNGLLAAEARAIAPRLFESTVFVSRLAVGELPLAQQIAEQTRRNCQQLTELILDLGGVPGPRPADPATAELHYQDLHYVLPRLLRDHEALTQRYRAAAERLAGDARVSGPVARLLRIHEDELARLRALRDQPSRAASQR